MIWSCRPRICLLVFLLTDLITSLSYPVAFLSLLFRFYATSPACVDTGGGGGAAAAAEQRRRLPSCQNAKTP